MWLVTCCISRSPWIPRKLPSFHTYKKLTTSSLFRETSNKVTLNHEAESHFEPLGLSILWSPNDFGTTFEPFELAFRCYCRLPGLLRAEPGDWQACHCGNWVHWYSWREQDVASGFDWLLDQEPGPVWDGAWEWNSSWFQNLPCRKGGLSPSVFVGCHRRSHQHCTVRTEGGVHKLHRSTND